MKVICEDKTTDLSKFETIRYRESLLGSSEGYPVEAIRHDTCGGFFSGTTIVTEEIVRFTRKEDAEALVKAITKEWTRDTKSFDVLAWLNEMKKVKNTENG